MTDSTPARRDAARTKAELLDVATRVFAESGFAGARVDDIAARTRTTKRMIYYYFGSKEGLYLAVLENAYRGIRAAERSLHPGDMPPLEAVRRIAELTYDHHLGHSAFIRLVSIENIHHGRYIERLGSLREMNQEALGILDDVLARGAREGSIRGDVDALDVHLVISSYCFFQVSNQYTFGYLFDHDLMSAPSRDHHRHMVGDVVVGWLSDGASPQPR